MLGFLPRTGLAAVLLGLALAGACASASSPLAAHEGDGGATSAGGAGTGTAAGGSSSGHGGEGRAGFPAFDGGPDGESDVVLPPDGPPADVAPDVFVDPDGPPEVRFLHGIGDAKAVRACLVPWKDGAPAATPAVLPSTDVAYGGVAPLAVPPGGGAGAFRVVVVGGDLAQIGAASCQDLLASSKPGLHLAALDVLPAGTLAAPRSLLLVATGCLGGVVLADPLSVCGAAAVPPKADAGADAAAPPDLSTAGLVVAELSRVAPPPDRVGLQVMHASSALGTLAVRLVPQGGQAPVSLAQGLGLGAISPHPPLLLGLDVAFGLVPGQAQVGVADANGELLLAAVGEGLAGGGIPAADLAPGKGFVLIVIGPHPAPSDAGTGGNLPRVVWTRQPVLGSP